MPENMSGFVGQAAHAERQRQAQWEMRVYEAVRRRVMRRSDIPMRVLLAKALVALAARIAPTASLPNPTARALAR